MDERRDVSSLRVFFFVCVSCVSWFGFHLTRVFVYPMFQGRTTKHAKHTKKTRRLARLDRLKGTVDRLARLRWTIIYPCGAKFSYSKNFAKTHTLAGSARILQTRLLYSVT